MNKNNYSLCIIEGASYEFICIEDSEIDKLKSIIRKIALKIKGKGIGEAKHTLIKEMRKGKISIDIIAIVDLGGASFINIKEYICN